MKANFDTTYCLNQECEKKCWRYFGNYEIDKIIKIINIKIDTLKEILGGKNV